MNETCITRTKAERDTQTSLLLRRCLSADWLKSKGVRTMHVLLLASKSLSVHSVEVVANLSFIGGRTEKCANSKRKALLLLNFVGQKGFAALCSPCMHVVDPVKKLQKSWISAKLNIHFLRNKNKGYKSHFGAKVQSFLVVCKSSILKIESTTKWFAILLFLARKLILWLKLTHFFKWKYSNLQASVNSVMARKFKLFGKFF